MTWIIVRSALAAVFAVSAVTKLLDRDGTRAAAEAFGVPSRFAPAVASLLPLAELAVAATLPFGRTARPGAALALALLAVFIAGIGFNLVKGRAPDCHCFGQLYSEPVGPATLVRNVVLAAAAAAVAFASGPGAGGSPFDTGGRSAAAGAAVIVVVGGLLVLGRRSHGLITGTNAEPPVVPGLTTRPRGPAVGSVAPAFALTDTNGGAVGLGDLLGRGRKVLLVFASPTCGPCVQLAPALADWQRQFPGRLTVGVLFSGNIETVRTKASEYGFNEVIHDPGAETARAYEGRTTPSAVLIDVDGRVALPLVVGGGAINELLIDAFELRSVVDSLAGPEDGAYGTHDDHDHDHDHDGEASESVPDELMNPEDIDGSFVPEKNDDVALTEHEGETVLLDRSSGRVHLMNPTAAIVWGCLDGVGTLDEIVSDIADAFGVPVAEIREAVVDVVRRFGRDGLLSGVGIRQETEQAAPPAP